MQPHHGWYPNPGIEHASCRVLGILCAAAIILAGSAHAHAQTPAPTATPTVTSSPDASPSPTPVDTALYLPVAATVQVTSGSGSTTNTAGSPQHTVSKTQTSSAGVNTSDATAAPAAALQVSSPDLFAPTSLAAQPQPATVTLAYNVACAGASVVVSPLDGGQINNAAGAQTITVGADGTLTFTFLAPSGPGRYHVIARLGTSQMALPFDVAAPASVTSN